ncbi:hypothetical protein D3C78_460920 [compost metagenome]
MPPQAQGFWIELVGITGPRLELGDGFKGKTRRIEVIKGQVRILGVLAEGHHHRQFTLAHDVIGFADIANIAHEQADVLHSHAPRPMAVGDVMAGVIVQLGPEEASASLAGTGAIPVEAHHVDQEVLQLWGVFWCNQHHMAGTTLVRQEACVRAARDKGARRPFLCIEQLMLVADRVAKTH